MHFQIIHTTEQDLDLICDFFAAAIQYQVDNNYPVWPSFEQHILAKDIEDRKQFKIIADNEMACVFTICYEDEVVWREKNKDKAIYLHRVVVNPKYKGRMLFGLITQWSLQLARAQNIDYLRMDTWADNDPLVKYYQRFGFNIIEYFTTPNSELLPIQQRGNKVVLLQINVNTIKTNSIFQFLSPVLSSKDVSTDVEWYCSKLGFKNVYDSKQYHEGPLDYAVLKKDNALLHLQFQFPADINKSDIKIEITNLKVFYQKCKEDGLFDREFNLDITPWNTIEFFVLDPTGNRITFIEDQ